MKVRGLDQILSRLETVGDAVAEAVTRGAEKGGADVILPAAKGLVPVDTGELLASGFVARDGKAVVVGFSASHAAIVHEDMSVHHSSGSAKFLERAARENADALLATVALQAKAALK